MIELGRFAAAIGLLGHVLAAEPDSGRGWCLLARAQLGAGRPADALASARRAAVLDPADDWPGRLASTALVTLGRHADAVAAAAQSRRTAPQHWRPHVCLAQAAAAAGQHEVAAEAAAQALALAPEEPDVHVTAGKAALGRGDLRTAAACQRAALALEPGHAGALNELGLISLGARDPAAAACYFAQAARAAPASAVFGRNAEVALARTVISVARLAAMLGVLAASAVALGVRRYELVIVLPAGCAGVVTWRLVATIQKLPGPARRRLRWLVHASGVRARRRTVRGAAG